MKIKAISSVSVLLFIALTAGLFAQEEVFVNMYKEYLELNQKLQAIQRQAMQDENLIKLERELDELITKRLIEIDSTLKKTLEDKTEILKELEIAEANKDTAALTELQKRFTAIHIKLQPYMAEILKQKDVSDKMNAFDKKLIVKMKEIDNQAGNMIIRLEEITNILQEISNQ
jgi:hypothetical protein